MSAKPQGVGGDDVGRPARVAIGAELDRLKAEWEARWERVSAEEEQARELLKQRAGLLGETRSGEQLRLDAALAAAEESTTRDRDARIGAVESSVQRTLASLARESKEPRSAKRYDSELVTMRSGAQQMPLVELARPSSLVDQLSAHIRAFERHLAGWAGQAAPQAGQIAPPTPGIFAAVKRGIAARARRLVGRPQPAPELLGAATNEAARQRLRAAYDSELNRDVAEYAQTLIGLKDEIVRSIRSNTDRQLAARREQALARLLPTLTTARNALVGAEAAVDIRRLQLHQTKLAANDQLQALETAVRRSQAQVHEDRKLVDQTVKSLRTQLAPSSASELAKRSYPPQDLSFSRRLGALYPELRMPAADPTAGSRCAPPPPVDVGIQRAQSGSRGGSKAGKPVAPPAPYQRLFPLLLGPDSPYRGFLSYKGVGSGKTREGWIMIDGWLSDLAAKGGLAAASAAPVIVLLPTSRLMGTWLSEAKLWLPRGKYEMPEPTRNDSSVVQKLILHQEGRSPITFTVILQRMVVQPSEAAYHAIAAHGNPIPAGGAYMLAAPGYDSHEAYRDLTADEKRILNELLAETKEAIEAKRNVVLPAGRALVIVDEADNLVNPAEAAKASTQSQTALAWSNAIKKAPDVKLLFLTATPLLDDSKLTDLFKLLNLLVSPAPRELAFEGTWRPSLPSRDTEARRNAVARADELESEFLVNQLFNTRAASPEASPDVGGEWKPGKKEAIQQAYAGLVSYVTLSNDPTVYPALSRECQNDPSQSCTLLWEPGSPGRLIDVSVDQLTTEFRLSKPSSGTNVLVRLSPYMDRKVGQAIEDDLKSWARHKRQEAPPGVAHTAEWLNYGMPDKQSKASVMHSFGMKAYAEDRHGAAPDKANVLLHLLGAYPTDKFFVFTSTYSSKFAKDLTKWLQAGALDVWGVKRLAEFVQKHRGSGDDASGLAERFIAEQGRKPRALLFIGSSTMTLEHVSESEALLLIGRVRDLMLALYNHPTNTDGSLVRTFIGDRDTKVGLSLLATMHVVFLEPSANATMQTQAEARILRFCSEAAFPHERWRQVRLWRLISLPAIPGPPRAPRRRLRVGGGRQSCPPHPLALHRLALPSALPSGWRPTMVTGHARQWNESMRRPIWSPRVGGWLPGSVHNASSRMAMAATPHGGPRFGISAHVGGMTRPSGRWLHSGPFVGGMRLVRSGGVGAGLSGAGGRTNEEWQYLYLEGRRPYSSLILQALKEAAIDCSLFRDYNGDPSVPACYGEAAPQGSAIDGFGQQGVGLGPQRSPYDAYCSASQYMLLQESDRADISELGPRGTVSLSTRRGPEEFESGCRAADAPVARISGGYRAALAAAALTRAPLPDPESVRAFYRVPDGQLLAFVVLQLASAPSALITGDGGATIQAALDHDRKMWDLARTLPIEQRAKLAQMFARVTQQLQGKPRTAAEGLARQVGTWIDNTDALRGREADLAAFLRTPPESFAYARRTQTPLARAAGYAAGYAPMPRRFLAPRHRQESIGYPLGNQSADARRTPSAPVRRLVHIW